MTPRRAARLVGMMLRPPVAVTLVSFAGLGMAQASGRDPSAQGLTLAAVVLVVVAWFVHATVLNDLADEAIDRVNLVGVRGRPLVSGDATRRELAWLGVGAGVVALVGAWSLGSTIGLIVTAGLVLNAAYSLPPVRICDRGALASVLLPAGYAALPFLVGRLAVDPHLDRAAVVLLAGIYVAFGGRILLKDFRDVEGDARYGKRTFLLRHGRRTTCRVSAACWIAGSATVVAVVPVRSLVVPLVAAYLAAALYGLRLLDRDDGEAGAARGGCVAEQVIVGAVARMGLAMVFTLTAHFSMVATSLPGLVRAAVLVSVGGAFASLASTAVRDLRVRDRVVTLPVA